MCMSYHIPCQLDCTLFIAANHFFFFTIHNYAFSPVYDVGFSFCSNFGYIMHDLLIYLCYYICVFFENNWAVQYWEIPVIPIATISAAMRQGHSTEQCVRCLPSGSLLLQALPFPSEKVAQLMVWLASRFNSFVSRWPNQSCEFIILFQYLLLVGFFFFFFFFCCKSGTSGSRPKVLLLNC